MELAQYGDWLPIYNSLLRESGYDAAQPPSIVRRQIGFTVEVRARMCQHVPPCSCRHLPDNQQQTGHCIQPELDVPHEDCN